MGDKSVQKRKYILEAARGVFSEKGYKSVTMKDIVEKCEISRGGLYLYYSSTAELFMDVLKYEASQTDKELENELAKGATASDILMVFLKAQKKEILQRKDSLTIAIYEYYFENRDLIEKADNSLRKQFDVGVKIVEKLLETGVESGEFNCAYPLLAAKNIMFAIEGMKVSAQTFGISPDTVDKELAFLLGSIAVEE